MSAKCRHGVRKKMYFSKKYMYELINNLSINMINILTYILKKSIKNCYENIFINVIIKIDINVNVKVLRKVVGSVNVNIKT